MNISEMNLQEVEARLAEINESLEQRSDEEELKALTDIPIFGYVPFVKALTS